MPVKWLKMTSRGKSTASVGAIPDQSRYRKPYMGDVCYCSDLLLVPKEGYYAVKDGQINPNRPLKPVPKGDSITYFE